MIRKPLYAGKFKDVDLKLSRDFKELSTIEKLSYPIYMHLVNQGVNPDTWRFKRQFHSARKRD